MVKEGVDKDNQQKEEEKADDDKLQKEEEADDDKLQKEEEEEADDQLQKEEEEEADDVKLQKEEEAAINDKLQTVVVDEEEEDEEDNDGDKMNEDGGQKSTEKVCRIANDKLHGICRAISTTWDIFSNVSSSSSTWRVEEEADVNNNLHMMSKRRVES